MILFIILLLGNAAYSQGNYESLLLEKSAAYKISCDNEVAGIKAANIYELSIDTMVVYASQYVDLRHFTVACFKFLPGDSMFSEVFYVDAQSDSNFIYLVNGVIIKSEIRMDEGTKEFYYYPEEPLLDSAIHAFAGEMIYYKGVFSHFIATRRNLKSSYILAYILAKPRRKIER